MPTSAEIRDLYIAAELAVLEGKETRIGDKSFRLEDLSEIRRGRQEWEARVAAESAPAGPANGGLGVMLASFGGGC